MKEHMSSTENLHAHVTRRLSTILCLVEADHLEGALTLLYAYIDHMAWLSTAGDDVEPEDFMNWVRKYILPTGRVNCDANDLWAARNGLLHMGNAKAKAVKNNKASPVYYYYGPLVPNHAAVSTAKLVSFTELLDSFGDGVQEFIKNLSNDPIQLAAANKKTKNMLWNRPCHEFACYQESQTPDAQVALIVKS
jgi:hypothetical protein